MLKSNEKLFALLQKFVDFIVVGISALLAYIFRFELLVGQEGLELMAFKIAFATGLITLYFFNKNGLYRSQRFQSRFQEILAVFKANGLAVIGLILLIYFTSEERFSRLFLTSYFLISTFLLTTSRLTIRNILRVLRRRGHNLRHVILIGPGKQARTYLENLKHYKDSGINVAVWVEPDLATAEYFKIKTTQQTLEEAKSYFKPDALVLAYSSSEANKVEQIIKENASDLVPIQVLPDLSYSFIGHKIEEFAGMPLLSFNTPNITAGDLALKRIFDFTLAFAGIIIISPLLLIIAIGIKFSSPGPIFFGQERMGLDGKRFKMWKFRSMKVADHSTQTQEWSNKDNPRKTKFGNFLRKTSLDELPQLWNVVIGDMGLVGPRPEQPFFVEKFRHEIPAYMLRHKMKAGITGLAQVNGWRGDTDLNKRIECDLMYIKNWSFWLDIKILFLTFWKGIINKNAY